MWSLHNRNKERLARSRKAWLVGLVDINYEAFRAQVVVNAMTDVRIDIC